MSLASGHTDYHAYQLLNYVYGGKPITYPLTWYLALFTDAYTKSQHMAGQVTEVVGGNYARVAIPNNLTNFPEITQGHPPVKKLGGTRNFNTPTADWGTITGFGFYEAPTGGHLWDYFKLDAPFAVPIGKVVTFGAGAIWISENQLV
jgi:hypothetical protein